ncbi:MAG: hypothetical protein K2F90_04095 [Clostridiales bacterium]|nr:hypothetical protein [Clostridiales bacterium]
MKQKILLTYVESGFGHISSMDSIYDALVDRFSSDEYEIEKSFILTEDGFPNLVKMNGFLIKQVQNTNKIPYFGRFVFPFIALLGGHKLLRFFHRQMAVKSFKQGLKALELRKPNIIISNHYFTDLLAVEYKRRIDPNVVVINYNPDPTLHTFWDRRDGIFIVDNPLAYKKAVKYKFKKENLRLVTPCVRKCIEDNNLTRDELRAKFDLPQDKFTVVIADGGYMLGRGPKFAKSLIKSGLPITLCVIAGDNKKRYDYFKAIEEGRGKLKVSPNMTFRTYGFLKNAYELYGAADVFLTKGGPNAVLDSVYMHTPVMINYCPHVIEAGTVKVFIGEHGVGETVYRRGKAVKRIRAFIKDKSPLLQYEENIEKLLAEGNGITAVADIVEEEAQKQRLVYESRGMIIGEDDGADKAQTESAQDSAEPAPDYNTDIRIAEDEDKPTKEGDVLR